MAAGDRISELEEPILHHILSFLSVKEIVETCLVCKTFLQAWKTIPVLKFDEAFSDRFWTPSDKPLSAKFWLVIGGSITEEECQTYWEKLYSYLDRTLQNRLLEVSIGLDKLTLALSIFTIVQQLDPVIDRWVRYAIEKNVKELKLENGYHYNCYRSRSNNWSKMVVTAKSITVLELGFCRLDSQTLNSVNLPSLRKLCLRHIFYYEDNDVIPKFVAGCPLIEYLKTDSVHTLEKLDFSGLNRLKKIKFMSTRHGKLEEINASSNVESISIFYPNYSTTTYIRVTCSNNLKVFKIFKVDINDERLAKQISNCPVLEHLGIGYCTKLQQPIISSPRLQALLVADCTNLIELKIETPNLNLFKYVGDTEQTSFSSNTLNLSQVDIYMCADRREKRKVIRLKTPSFYTEPANCQDRVRLCSNKIVTNPDSQLCGAETLLYFRIKKS